MARVLLLAIVGAAPLTALFLAACGRSASLDAERDAGGGGAPDAAVSDSSVEDATLDAEAADAPPDDGALLAVTPMVDTNGMVSCGIRTNGTLVCWGGVATFGAPPAGTFRQLSLGSVGCAVRTDGTLACWGTEGYYDDRQALRSPPEGEFVQVSVGVIHACAVRMDGAIECWGKGQEGSDNTCGTEPLEYGANWCGQATPLPGTFLHVSSGYLHTCAIRTDGTLACWGAGTTGLGQPSACPWPEPYFPRVYRCGQSSPPSGTFIALSAARYGNCAIRTDGTLACWGGDIEWLNSVEGQFSQVSATTYGGCAIRRTGELLCDEYLQPDSRPAPNGARFEQASGAGAGGCGIREDGSAVCWGLPCSYVPCPNKGWLDPPADFP